MSWGFACHVTGGGRGLAIRQGSRPVAEIAFGLPGEPVRGWEPDDEDARLTSTGPLTARLRHLPDADGWTSIVTLDNAEADEQALPPLGLAVTLAPGWVGWSWTSDTEGFLVISPSGGQGEVLRLEVTRGFLRATHARPVFTPADRRGEGLESGVAAFHLANPTGSLRGHGRLQTTIELSSAPDAGAAAAGLPSWLPGLIVAPGDELRLDTPDQAIVPGPGVELTTEDTTAVLTGEAGHREVAVHGLKGVQRLRVSFVPALEMFLADLVAALKSRRPSAMPSATAAVIAAALARRTVLDADSVLDWLEREDWLARGDLFGPAIAAVVATETHDEALLRAACDAVLDAAPQAGRGIVATRCWLATLRLGLPPLDLTRVFVEVGDDPLQRFEVAALRNADREEGAQRALHLAALLGGDLPGQPVGVSEADAGLAIALLRLVPEDWRVHGATTPASEKASALLLADHADGLHPSYDGLAWVLLGDIGS